MDYLNIYFTVLLALVTYKLFEPALQRITQPSRPAHDPQALHIKFDAVPPSLDQLHELFIRRRQDLVPPLNYGLVFGALAILFGISLSGATNIHWFGGLIQVFAIVIFGALSVLTICWTLVGTMSPYFLSEADDRPLPKAYEAGLQEICDLVPTFAQYVAAVESSGRKITSLEYREMRARLRPVFMELSNEAERLGVPQYIATRIALGKIRDAVVEMAEAQPNDDVSAFIERLRAGKFTCA